MKSTFRISITTVMLSGAAILLCGLWFYRHQERALEDQAHTELASIANLKAAEIGAWHDEWLIDASLLSESPFLAAGVHSYLASPGPDTAAPLLATLRTLQEQLHLLDITLMLPDGQPLLLLPETSPPLAAHAAEALAAACASGLPSISELHAEPPDLPIHLDVIAPLPSAGHGAQSSIAAIVMRVDANAFLFPLVQQWPTTSETAETLLVRRDDDDVLFLNELRHQQGTALNLRIPLTQDDLPASLALLGKQGIVSGRDYRGEEVLAYLASIPNTDWHMVAKVDRAEALAAWHQQATLILVLILGMLLVPPAALLLVRQRESAAVLRKLLAAQAARHDAEARFRTTLLSVGDGVITTDAQGRVTLMNAAAEHLTGFSDGEAQGRPLEAVFNIINENTRGAVPNPVTRVLAEGRVIGLANHTLLIRPDGVETPIADSGAPIRDEQGNIHGVVLVFQDQTVARQAEAELRRNEAHLRSLVTILQHQVGSRTELLDNALEQAIALTDSRLGYIYLYSEKQQRFVLNSWSRGVMDACSIVAPLTTYDLEKTGFWGEAVRQRRPVMLNEFNAPHPLKRGYPEGHAPLHRFLTVPIFSDDQIVAVVGVANKETDYSEVDVLQLKLLMGAVWRLVDRRLAEESLARQRAAEEMFADVTGAIQGPGVVDETSARLLLDLARSLTGSTAGMLTSVDPKTGAHRVWCATQTFAELHTVDENGYLVLPRTSDGRLAGFWSHLLDKDGGSIENKVAPGPDATWTPSNLLAVPVRLTDQNLGLLLLTDADRDYQEIDLQNALRVAHFWGLILQQMRLMEQLAEREADLLLAQQTAKIGAWQYDIVRDQTRWSRQMFPIFDLDPATGPLTWQAHRAHIHPDDWTRVDAAIRLAADKAVPYDLEFRIVRRDGAINWAWSRGQVRCDTAGKPIELYGTVQDISAQKLQEKQRNELRAQLQQSQKMEAIGSLAGGIAHDFNNLLSVILSYVEFSMEALQQGDPIRDDLAEVQRAGQQAASLTRQLLAFSRKQVLTPVVLDLNAVVTTMENMLKRLLGENIEFIIRLAPDLGTVEADRGQIEQVIMNLAVNARDAMPQGGRLVIETAVVTSENAQSAADSLTPGNCVLLSFTDSGVGMDSQTLGRVFEPFFTTKGKGKGTGLGLSTVYGIIKQSGGSIRATSQPGMGSCFQVYLPRTEAREHIPAQKNSQVSPHNHERILVVEDEEHVRRMTIRILESSGYQVEGAANGGEALLVCEQASKRPDLLLTDVIMPKMSGKQLVERLATLCPGLRVLYMSGYTDDAIAQHGVLEPGVKFIGKPFTAQELVAKVREVLDEDPQW